jgi:glucose dehydrogenase
MKQSTQLEFSDDFSGNNHIVGTVIMGSNPATSVVDGECRSHDHSNLFLAGPGVMATNGSVNPTLTSTALALRAAAIALE